MIFGKKIGRNKTTFSNCQFYSSFRSPMTPCKAFNELGLWEKREQFNTTPKRGGLKGDPKRVKFTGTV